MTVMTLAVVQTHHKPTRSLRSSSSHQLSVFYHVTVSYCIVVVLLWTRWGEPGPGGNEAWFLGPICLQCFDTVGWVVRPVKTRPQYDL